MIINKPLKKQITMQTEINPFLTIGQKKAMDGRNTLLRLAANHNWLSPTDWNIHTKINYKAMFANPMRYYTEYSEINAIQKLV